MVDFVLGLFNRRCFKANILASWNRVVCLDTFLYTINLFYIIVVMCSSSRALQKDNALDPPKRLPALPSYVLPCRAVQGDSSWIRGTGMASSLL